MRRGGCGIETRFHATYVLRVGPSVRSAAPGLLRSLGIDFSLVFALYIPQQPYPAESSNRDSELNELEGTA